MLHSPPSPLPQCYLKRLYKAFPETTNKKRKSIQLQRPCGGLCSVLKSDSQFTSSPLKYQISCRRGRQTGKGEFPLSFDWFATNLNCFSREIRKTNFDIPKWKRQTVFWKGKTLPLFELVREKEFVPIIKPDKNKTVHSHKGPIRTSEKRSILFLCWEIRQIHFYLNKTRIRNFEQFYFCFGRPCPNAHPPVPDKASLVLQRRLTHLCFPKFGVRKKLSTE